MAARIALSVFALASSIIACPQHDFHPEDGTALRKRAAGQDWAYEASFNWGMINTNYSLCQTGMTQSPIPLLLSQGISLTHTPTFNFPPASIGTWSNWGYGPGFTLNTNATEKATVTFQDKNDGVNETATLKGWHIHAPADHTVQGDRSKAELHMVFADAAGKERVVFAFRIDPGNTESKFFSQLPPMISYSNKTEIKNTSIQNRLAIAEVNAFAEFWTYRGSLTSPPCREGIRWYVARNIMFVSNKQMQDILSVSTYSARAEQEVWLHAINV
ncbi:hypothetical protein EG328_002850 [Venturia inaequalis]|uniref:Alpha-carbonic anhydrase domain-containing protein n=2 Tax=Venturia inaequalis TaxID=5025 RepID=A0A8H3UT16_VENIN|nr:hypothetical protein EG327_002572 [Venturia inaequalis]KAE9976079.1 hypothetical protein EG328_002850 [Venturia inaequalis]